LDMLPCRAAATAAEALAMVGPMLLRLWLCYALAIAAAVVCLALPCYCHGYCCCAALLYLVAMLNCAILAMHGSVQFL
jgi:hypothetical protein